ncbi:MAG: F0F1 ATP synthase subunit B [Xanthobacteraceae bacterium]|nr:F0F1 ATP synthase subunit B [Xanthobacteraceae bacterium]
MAEPTAHTEAPGAKHAFPPFEAQHFPSQLLWLTLTFILLYVLMSRIALPRIAAIFAERHKHIADDLAAAQRFKERSDAANAAYQKSLADARARAQAIANETRARQAQEAEATNKRLEGELNERMAAAERSIAATRTAAMGNVGSIAEETATAIVERLIGTTPNAQDVAAAVGATKR